MKSIAHSLETQLKTILSNPISNPSKGLLSCAHLESLYRKSNEANSDLSQKNPEEARKLLAEVLKKSTLDAHNLRDFFLATPRPSSEASIMILDEFNRQGKVVPTNIAMVPFREATYSCEFDHGFQIMDRTTGNLSQYVKVGQAKLRKLALGWSTGVCGVLVGVDQLLTSGLVGDWGSNKPMVLVMVFVYLSAVSTYGFLALGGRNNDRAVSWVSGTPLAYRFKHKLNLDMASNLAQMNTSLPENQGECAPKMIQELKERFFRPVETSDEESIKEYWARGGEGFDWVEPDQDPADIIWREKMDSLEQKRLGSPYVRKENGQVQTWARTMLNIEENRTIPHASLTDVDALRGPEKMLELEEELKKLKEELNDPNLLDKQEHEIWRVTENADNGVLPEGAVEDSSKKMKPQDKL